MIFSKKKRKNVFLHIGTHKTGTTTIQEFTKRNKAYLHQEGLASVVDDSILTNSSKQRAAHRVAEILATGSKAKRWDSLRRSFASVPSKMPILLSSERFFRYFSGAKDDAGKLLISNNIKSVFGQHVRFILYVRNFSEYFNSLVAERIIATSECRPLEGIIRSLSHLAEIQTVVEHLQKEFGQESVSVRSFDAAVKAPGGLLADFAGQVGWANREGVLYPQEKLHSMPPANFLALKYQMNCLQMSKRIYRVIRRQIANIVPKHPRTVPFRIIDDETVSDVIELCRKLNPLLADQADIAEDLLFAPKVGRKTYIDIWKPGHEEMLEALLELYQLSIMRDATLVKVFGSGRDEKTAGTTGA